ncbi:hypothetical protein ACYE2N_08680 [Flavobacterium sp. MAHUQ-51]|uniref:hypothetical protein n=1 Tax=Flavobacterium sp. GCM10022190 TaxID=3252639 RepID=UPI0036092110
MSTEKKEIHTNGFGGIYVKIIDNLTNSDIQITVREYPNKSLSIEAKCTNVAADFPLAWASNPNDEGKCTLIEIPGIANLLLWDDKNGSAFYSKTGHWSSSGLKPFGTQSSWGDYKLTIKENGNLRMDKIN